MSLSSPILVTGANRRVGLALCKHLAANGLPVLAVYRHDAGELAALERVIPLQADLTRQADLDRLCAMIRERTKNLRAIIHNASVWLDDDMANLDTMTRLHIAAPYFLNTELQPLLAKSERADIIHVGDDTAARGSANHIAYAATKAALLNMTLSFAAKLGPSIRVNAISPGLLSIKDGASTDYANNTVNKALVKGEPGPEPLISAVDYLLSASYCAGTNLIINGGRHLREKH